MSRKSKKPSAVAKMVPDFALWARVTKTIEPVNPDLAKELEKFTRDIVPMAKQPAKQTGSVNSFKKTATQMANPGTFQFTGLDRRQQQRLLRGKVEIDGRIDLHGESLESARYKLWQFLSACATRGDRTVLVITGKGSSRFTRHTLHGRGYHESEHSDGRLRNALPDWMHDPEFKSLVSGFQPAHPKHGGGGAVYIRLRNLAKHNRTS